MDTIYTYEPLCLVKWLKDEEVWVANDQNELLV